MRMKNMKKYIATLLALTMLWAASTAPAHAEEGQVPPPHQNWSFIGPYGTWDVAEVLRGYHVATQVCFACHSFKYVTHRDLMKLGFSEAQVKKLADAMGLKISDPLISTMKPADAQASFGKVPPDLSLMTIAREYGPDYVYGILTGFATPPKDFKMPDTGGSYNIYFPGHVIAMPQPIPDTGVDLQDGTHLTQQQAATAVVNFLAWTAEPERVQRQQLGVYVLLYLVILSGLLYTLKKRVWADIKKPKHN